MHHVHALVLISRVWYMFILFCLFYRSGVVLVSSGANHPSQNFQSINGDVSCCVDVFLRHHFAIDKNFGARLADCNMKLKKGEKKSETF